MKQSSFQFSDPFLKDISFSINEDFSPPADGVSIEIETEVEVHPSKEDGRSALVNIHISLGRSAESAPFTLSMTMAAVFRWEEPFSKEAVDKLLSKNAPALLIGYARPIIAMVTNASPFPAYNLPFINLKDG